MPKIENVGGTPSQWTLTGVYSRNGKRLTGPHHLLVVGRSTTTTAKSGAYLLKVHPDGKRSYVSSLWRSHVDRTYELEYRGLRYTMTVTDERVVVAPYGGTPPYINRGSGNSIAANG